MQKSRGALFADGQQSGSPLHFGSPRDEYLAATTSAALFDFSHHAMIEMTGSDRTKFLHGFCTNDVKRITTGEGCEAFVTNVKGKLLGHIWIVATETSLWLQTLVGSAEPLINHLSRYLINEDVMIADRTSDFAELMVLGPEGANRLARIGTDVSSLANLQGRPMQLFGMAARVRRFDVGEYSGYVFATPRAQIGEFWARLCDAEIRSAGSQVWTALRIEAGLPVYGVDLTDDHLAQEAGRTKTAISFTKGCYLGQEPIARIDAMGHVNRELRSLRLAEESMTAIGAHVFADSNGAHVVGTVTSAAYSHAGRSGVAMAVLRSTAAKVGAAVFVQFGNGTRTATVFWPAG